MVRRKRTSEIISGGFSENIHDPAGYAPANSICSLTSRVRIGGGTRIALPSLKSLVGCETLRCISNDHRSRCMSLTANRALTNTHTHPHNLQALQNYESGTATVL